MLVNLESMTAKPRVGGAASQEIHGKSRRPCAILQDYKYSWLTTQAALLFAALVNRQNSGRLRRLLFTVVPAYLLNGVSHTRAVVLVCRALSASM